MTVGGILGVKFDKQKIFLTALRTRIYGYGFYVNLRTAADFTLFGTILPSRAEDDFVPDHPKT